MRESHCVVSRTLYVDQTSLKLMILLTLSPEFLSTPPAQVGGEHVIFFFTWPTAFQLHVHHNFLYMSGFLAGPLFYLVIFILYL